MLSQKMKEIAHQSSLSGQPGSSLGDSYLEGGRISDSDGNYLLASTMGNNVNHSNVRYSVVTNDDNHASTYRAFWLVFTQSGLD